MQNPTFSELNTVKLEWLWCLTLNLTETPFNTFENRADPGQAALERAV